MAGAGTGPNVWPQAGRLFDGRLFYMDIFVLTLAAQQVLLYLIDYEAERRFAGRRPRDTLK